MNTSTKNFVGISGRKDEKTKYDQLDEKEREKLICEAVESFLVKHGESSPIRNGHMVPEFFRCDNCWPCEQAGQRDWTMDDEGVNYPWWSVYEIKNDDRFLPNWDFRKVNDSEVWSAAELLTAQGKLDSYQCAGREGKYFCKKI